MTTVLDTITIEQLRALRAAGFVVVHQVPSENMKKAGAADKWPEDWCIPDIWHRMVAQSIREQNAEIDGRVTLTKIIENLTGQPVDAKTAAELQKPIKGWIESRTVEETGYFDAVRTYEFPMTGPPKD